MVGLKVVVPGLNKLYFHIIKIFREGEVGRGELFSVRGEVGNKTSFRFDL